MENSNSKIVVTSLAALSAIVGLTVYLLLKAFAGAFGVVARLTDSDVIRHMLPAAVGIILFFTFYFNKRIMTWSDEVVMEIKKVVWPSSKDVKAMTIAVLIMVVISSFIIMGFDFTSSYIINKLLK